MIKAAFQRALNCMIGLMAMVRCMVQKRMEGLLLECGGRRGGSCRLAPFRNRLLLKPAS